MAVFEEEIRKPSNKEERLMQQIKDLPGLIGNFA